MLLFYKFLLFCSSFSALFTLPRIVRYTYCLLNPQPISHSANLWTIWQSFHGQVKISIWKWSGYKKNCRSHGKNLWEEDFRRKELMEWVAKMGVDIIRLPDRFIAHHSPVSTIIQSMSVSYIMNLDTLWVPFNSIIQFRYVVLAIVFIESPAFKS